MTIEYQVKDVVVDICMPPLISYVPMYRRKLKGFYCIFQLFYFWHTFRQISIHGKIECIVKYETKKEACNFLLSVESPWKWEEDLEKKTNKKLKGEHFEKEY